MSLADRWLTRAFAILVASVLLPEPPVLAVCPQPQPIICAEFFKSDAVLVGTVVSETAVPGEADFIEGWTYHVGVSRAFRGPTVPTIDLFTENDSGRLRLKVGRQYLLFANRREGKWAIGGCGNSRLLKDAQGLITQIDQVGKGSSGKIYGRIVSLPSQIGVSGVEVVARGATDIYRAVSGADGSFHITVRPGKYSVVVESAQVSPYDLSYDDPSNFEVRKGGCAQLQFISTAPFHTPAAELLREIESEGPRPVLVRLWNDEARFKEVCDKIESGDASWLEVARRLKAGSDAAASLSLDYSVARALPRVPEKVLKLINHGFTVDDVCTSPFIEPEPGVAESYQRRASAALRALRSHDLEAVRDECLKRI